MRGSKTVDQAGTYGTKGFPRTDTEPGARNGGTCWIDKNGNFWLFGGYGCTTNNAKGYLNDLWRYNPDTNMWTWVSGTQYINQAGTYGIKGTPNAANIPGGRSRGGRWIDNDGNFWIFGGFGFDATASLETLGELNDLWRYDCVTNQWTWTSGSNRIKQAGTYGTKGTPAAANVPGARGNSVAWTDSSDNLWLFGGGYFFNPDYITFNDLWRYDPTTGMWTWMNGSDTTEQSGVYGTMGIPDAGNVPGTRLNSISWIDKNGNVWLWGGYGCGDTTSSGYLNDLWRYAPAANQWVWMDGSSIINTAGVYGSKGTPDAANTPGARSRGVFIAQARP